MASGNPSRRAQIAATSAALAAVKSNPRRTRPACWTKRLTAPDAAMSVSAGPTGPASGGTWYSYSPCRCSGRREVVITTSWGTAASNVATTPAASSSCSRLSSTSKAVRPASWRATALPGAESSSAPTASASAFHITSALLTAASGTK